MRIHEIVIEPFVINTILSIQIQKTINEHITAEFTVITDEIEGEAFVHQAKSKEVIIKAFDPDEKSQVVFSGIIRHMEMSVVGGVNQLLVRAVSRSVLADQVECLRTFQSSSTTYGEIISHIKKSAKGFSILMAQNSSKSIGAFLMQYKETDWEFCKRLASRLNTCVVADYKLNQGYFSIGLPKKQQAITINPSEYRITKHLERFYLEEKAVKEQDMLCYEFESRYIYDLCSPVLFHGKNLYIFSVHSYLNGEVLVHKYALAPKGAFGQKEYHNTKIQGLSLHCSVCDVNNTEVSVEVHGDLHAFANQKKLFSFATVHSTPNGAGWYFMPDKGERVRLHFPTQVEDDAYVVNEEQANSPLNRYDGVHSLSSKYGQAIIFQPDTIEIRNNDGSTIIMKNGEGIYMQCNGNLSIQAAENVIMEAGKGVTLKGEQGVLIQQGNNKMTIEDVISMKSATVRIKR